MTEPILTKRQKEIYEFIKKQIEGRGYGPTVREIGAQFGISSPNGVMCHLHALEKKALIVREAGKSRAIRLVGQKLFTNPKKLTVVIDAEAEECLYVDGELWETDTPVTTHDIEEAGRGKVITICHREIDYCPSEWPRNLEDILNVTPVG